MPRAPRLLIIIAFVAIVLTALWLFAGRFEVGVRGEWTVQPNAGAWPLGAWGLPIAVLFIFGGLAALSAYDRFQRAKTDKERRASTRLTIGALTILCFAWPWALLGPGGTQNLISASWSDTSNEYFATAYKVENARDFSRDYATRWQKPKAFAQAHVATHPPGAVLFYYGARRVFESAPFLQNWFGVAAQSLIKEEPLTIAAQAEVARSSAARSAGADAPFDLPASAAPAAIWCAFLISLILAAAVPAVYMITASGSTASPGNEARGMMAAALFVLAPSVGLFAFTLDALIAAGAVWTLGLLVRYFGNRNLAWLITAGALMALVSFLSLGALTVGVLAALFLFRQIGWAKRRQLFVVLGTLLAGFLGGWLLICLVFPMSPLTVFTQAMAAHRAATVAHRGSLWIAVNVLMFALFCGWPAVVASLRSLVLPRSSTVVSSFAFAAWLTIILLTLSGSARGEVERLWLFLIPPVCIGAVASWDETSAPVKSIVIAACALIMLQAAQTLMMASTLAPLVRPL